MQRNLQLSVRFACSSKQLHKLFGFHILQHWLPLACICKQTLLKMALRTSEVSIDKAVCGRTQSCVRSFFEGEEYRTLPSLPSSELVMPSVAGKTRKMHSIETSHRDAPEQALHPRSFVSKAGKELCFLKTVWPAREFRGMHTCTKKTSKFWVFQELMPTVSSTTRYGWLLGGKHIQKPPCE